MFIFQIDAVKISGAENNKGLSKPAENPESVLLESMFSKPICLSCQPIDPPVIPPNGEIPPAQLLGKIMELANEYIIYAQQHPLSEDGMDIMIARPWQGSSELYEALAQYTGIPIDQNGNVHAVHDFFNNIRMGKPADQNNDGRLDYNDVLAIWGGSTGDGGEPPITQGDINGDGQINQADVGELSNAIYIGDMNGDKKLDGTDYEQLKEIIETIDLPSPQPPLREGNDTQQIEEKSIINILRGDLNRDGRLDSKDLDLLGKILKTGDMDNDRKVDHTDLELLMKLVGNQDPLTKIKDLSKALLEDPYHNLTAIPELGKALAKYTNTEYDLGKADRLISFFLRDKSDLTGDGQIDHQDVIAFWKNLDKPTMPEFPKHVNIDLDNDGKIEYAIKDGKIFKLPPPNTKQPVVEVDSIPGVDLQKLSDEIKKQFEECDGKPHPMPVCTTIQFNGDINGDGKIDHITADTGLIIRNTEERKNAVREFFKFHQTQVHSQMTLEEQRLLYDQINVDHVGSFSNGDAIDIKDLKKVFIDGKCEPNLPPPLTPLQQEFPYFMVKIYPLTAGALPPYEIKDGKIFKIGYGYTQQEVDSIPGVNLHKLSEEIKKQMADGYAEFTADLDGDGTIEWIQAM